MLVEKTPWPFSYLTGSIHNQIKKGYTKGELEQSMVFLEGELGEGDWFDGGDKPGKSDFMVVFWLDLCVKRGWVKLESVAPNVGRWRERVGAREAWRRGLEKGGEYDFIKMG